ncbi:hypothetical protein NL108_001919 [Boleophthalmus pectinirostris]|uniref:mucin-4 n=1 Tax=Boleophthalmus pectinirostris TaxID=150288 RepID=UPI002430D5D3|nr:mucin-4 [Boleophthalmus pectinirostris]KAJ0054770.1 hypothetical protein NL108_001919 [Boleophthalmus pectinirostris]
MAKKLSSKKTFKSLFSKSEVNLNETVAALAESGANGSSTSVDRKSSTDKKKFKFPVLKSKSKSSDVLGSSAPESAQVPSGNSSADNVSTDTNRSLLYATAPRSKGKELSSSDLDLTSKPKRFNTFSLNLRKKKKKEDNVLSRSTYGIDRSGIELQQETPSDLSQMSLAQRDIKNLSKSQPELDSSPIFDIPSPPHLAVNRPDYPIPSQPEASVTVHPQPIKTQQTGVQNTTLKAPIATIPELKLDNNKMNTAIEEVTPKVSSYKEATVASSRVEKALSNFAALKSNNATFDPRNIQVSNTKTEMPISQPALTVKQPEINTTANGSKIAATGTDRNVKVDTGIDPKITATSEKLAINSNSTISSKVATAVTDKPLKIEPTAATGSEMTAIGTNVKTDTVIDSKMTVAVEEPIKSNSAINSKVVTAVTDKQLKVDTATAIGPKMDATLEDKQTTSSYSAINFKMVTTNLDKPVESLSPVKNTVTDTHLKIDSTAAIEPKMTVKMGEPAINSFSVTKSTMSTTILDKQVESPNAISNTASSTKTVSTDTKLDTKLDTKPDMKTTNSPTISSNDSFVSVTTSPKAPQNESNVLKTEKSPPNIAEQNKMYQTLYDSLFPENFTQEIASSLLNQPANLATENKIIETTTETVVVKRYEENETIGAPFSTSSSEKIDDNLSSISSASDNLATKIEPKSPTKTVYIRTTYDMISNDAEPLTQNNKFAYSEFNTETTYVKDTLTRSSVVEKSPPLFRHATSQETSAQISTDSKRKVLLVKELVANETASTSTDSGCLSPTMEKTSTVTSSDLIRDQSEVLSFTSGQSELHDGICSPAYLSVGSDDGSTMEMFFSAEEDNGDDLFTSDDREATIIETTKGASVLEDLIANRTVILKEDTVNRAENAFEVDLQRGKKVELYDGNGMLSGSQVVKDKNERKEEFLTAPVEQLKEFIAVPPFKEESGQKEVPGISQIELKDASLVQDSTDSENSLTKDVKTPNTTQENSSTVIKLPITPRFTEEAERVLTTIGTYENDKESMLADSAKEILNAKGNNRAAVSTAEVDIVTEGAGRSTQEQVAVAKQGILQVREEGDQGLDQGLNQGLNQDQGLDQGLEKNQTDRSEGSFSSSYTSVFEQKFSTPSVLDSSDKMSLGYSSLSTTLSLKTSSPPPNEDLKSRVRKVSLVSENEDETKQETEDSDRTITTTTTTTTVTSNGADLDTDYKWKSRYEGAYQFKPNTFSPSKYTLKSFTTTFTDTATDTTTATSTSFPEAIDYNKSISSQTASNFSQVLSDRSDETDAGSGRGLGEKGAGPSSAPALERREGEAERSDASRYSIQTDEEEEEFSGVFKATLVDLEPDSPVSAGVGALASPPGTPEESPSQFDMDSLVDTLKNMGPSMRIRSLSARGAQSSLLSSSLSLPPIVEDAPSPVTANSMMLNNHKTEVDGLNGSLYMLPPDIGLKKSSLRDMRSPLELMKQQAIQEGTRLQDGTRPLRASTANSIVMKTSKDNASPEELHSPHLLNGTTSSRLENSIIFSSFRSSSIDQNSENPTKSHRTLFRTASLPDIGHSNDRMSLPPRESTENDSSTSRIERFSFLLNSSSSSGSLTGGEDYTARMSRAPSLSIGSPPSGNSPTMLLSPTGSLELSRPFAPMGDAPIRVGAPLLQRSFSGDSGVGLQQGAPMFNNIHANTHFQSQQEPEAERNLLSKYRAFPDAYLTKEKEHGKLNPRPGKMYLFDRAGMCGQRTEIRGDVVDATSWELEETISIRVLRGGWVLYEKPDFKGEKIALDEGEIELTNPFGPMEEQMPQVNGQMNGQVNGQVNGGHMNETNGEQETTDSPTEDKKVRRCVIGSIRRVVRDYSVPEISLFPEENAEGKKVVFRDTSEDARIFGFPIKANSIIINAGLWLVYSQPFFQGIPRVLEVGGYSNPKAWGVEQPYVGSLHPLKIGEPRVENMGEPTIVVYEKPYFCGKSRTITTNAKDFMTRTERGQQAFMHNVCSLKVVGGIWVGYEKEGFRGHQYLLEEGDYQDWRVWGGCDAELRSVRVIRADLTDPVMVMFEQPDEEQGEQEENTFEVTEAIPDVELYGFKTSTRSIQVLSGAWVAYSHVDFSGHQYILEKGFYNTSADWGSLDSRICSVQPILPIPRDSTTNRNQILLYNEPDFQGQCLAIDRTKEALSDKLLPKSCRVVGGSWVLYENKQFQGNMYVLSEGDYPNLTSMGCPATCYLRSVKAVPVTLSVPSISLFGLECLEGKEITTETEIFSLVEEGYNNHVLSVRVNSGCWVICEHSNYRGRQFLLEPIEITNWPKFSTMQTIGSMYPVRQKRSLFRVKSRERGHYLSVQGGVEEMKSGRVVVTPEVEPMSDIWYYEAGLIKNKLSPTMSLQVMGNVEPGAKVVLWSENRQPIQSWTAQMKGLVTSLTFAGMVLDIKGGKTYDKDHVVIMHEDEDRPSQQWEIEML